MPSVAEISFTDVINPLPKRPKDSHKGMFGHVVVVGGDFGMPGAVRLAAEGALRIGAGVVSVLTRELHVAPVVSGRPELLCYGVNETTDIDVILQRATVVIIGPGLGKSLWSKNLFARVMALPIPKIIDADGLNLLANLQLKANNWILTPHPGEAARLLGTSVAEIQTARVNSLLSLQKKYGGVIVLKGHGTLIGATADKIFKSIVGNPGMATAGMGDLLTGIIAGIVAQGVDLLAAAKYGVVLHGHAGDKALAKRKTTSVLASDLLSQIPKICLHNLC